MITKTRQRVASIMRRRNPLGKYLKRRWNVQLDACNGAGRGVCRVRRPNRARCGKRGEWKRNNRPWPPPRLGSAQRRRLESGRTRLVSLTPQLNRLDTDLWTITGALSCGVGLCVSFGISGNLANTRFIEIFLNYEQALVIVLFFILFSPAC